MPSADAIVSQAEIASHEEEAEDGDEHGDDHGEELGDRHDEEHGDEEHPELGGSFRKLSGEQQDGHQDEHGEDDHQDEQADEHQDEQQAEHLDLPDPTALANETVVPPMTYFVPSANLLAGVEWATEEPGQTMYLPRWQTSPYFAPGLVNVNMLKDGDSQNMLGMSSTAGRLLWEVICTRPRAMLTALTLPHL